jgi:hypothetical protein
MGRRGDWGLAEGAGGARGTERRVKPRERRGVGVVREGVVGMVRAGGGCRAREMPWLPVLRGDAGTRGEGVRYRTDDDNIWLFLTVGYIYQVTTSHTLWVHLSTAGPRFEHEGRRDGNERASWAEVLNCEVVDSLGWAEQQMFFLRYVVVVGHSASRNIALRTFSRKLPANHLKIRRREWPLASAQCGRPAVVPTIIARQGCYDVSTRWREAEIRKRRGRGFLSS